MAYTFRRSGRAIFITSSTTAVAFFGNAFSEMMPIRAFGIFAGTIVPVNYVLVILFMPPTLIWYENNFAHRDGFQYWAKLSEWCTRKPNKVEKSEEDKNQQED